MIVLELLTINIYGVNKNKYSRIGCKIVVISQKKLLNLRKINKLTKIITLNINKIQKCIQMPMINTKKIYYNKTMTTTKK